MSIIATMTDKPTRRYDPHPGLVALGTRVEVELLTAEGDSEELAFDVVPDEAADFASGFLGASTPLARAIMGRPAGSHVPYNAGDIVEARILSVERSERTADRDAAAERDAATRDAVNRAEAEDTIRLALTFNSKWGDYDPEPLERDDEDDQIED
jgi:hypothetical protein